MQANLNGKVIAVVGATGGVGEGIVRSALESGATVIAIGRSARKLEELKTNLGSGLAGRLVLVESSLDQEDDQTKEIQEKLLGLSGPLDGAVVSIGNWENNQGSLLGVSDSVWNHSIADNITAHFRAIRILFPLLKKTGALVHISGLSADLPYPGAALIGLTNAAKKSMVLSLAEETKASGKRVYELVIGVIQTRERVAKGMARSSWQTPEEIGNKVGLLIDGRAPDSHLSLHYSVEKEA